LAGGFLLCGCSSWEAAGRAAPRLMQCDHSNLMDGYPPVNVTIG